MKALLEPCPHRVTESLVLRLVHGFLKIDLCQV